jgi:hypothetical protein
MPVTALPSVRRRADRCSSVCRLLVVHAKVGEVGEEIKLIAKREHGARDVARDRQLQVVKRLNTAANDRPASRRQVLIGLAMKLTVYRRRPPVNRRRCRLPRSRRLRP